MTSRAVVDRVSRVLGTKKIGHTGTLDPMATGILVLTIGKCTRLSEFLTAKSKEYTASFVLGKQTDTLDITGTVIASSDKYVSIDKIKAHVASFKGTYLQEVPAYSAIKVEGRRLYDYARNGEKVELPKRAVTISSLEILSIEDDEITIRTRVSKGTYIRSLIRDIGRALGTYATMTSLRRTEQGSIGLDKAKTLEEIEAGNYSLITPRELLADIENIDLDDETYKKVSNGVKMTLVSQNEYITFTYHDELVALYRKDKEEIYKMYVAFF